MFDAPETRASSRAGESCRAPKKYVAQRTQNTYFPLCPISHVPVVVCQSVGIRTRGRTAAKGRRSRGSLKPLGFKRPAPLSRDAVEGDFAPCNRDWQPEANRRTPLSNGGRDLKQRRIGLFWSLPAFHQPARLPKRLVLHCQVCGREFPNQSTAAQFDLSSS